MIELIVVLLISCVVFVGMAALWLFFRLIFGW